MSMREYAVNDYGLIMDGYALKMIASKVCKDYTDEEYKEDEDLFNYDMIQKQVTYLKSLLTINNNQDIKPFLYNDLEYAVFADYKELQDIKQILPNAIMSGSGSTYFVLVKDAKTFNNNGFDKFENLHFIPNGVSLDD